MNSKIEIKHWLTGSILFEFECDGNTILKTLVEAVNKKADLRGADLYDADLRGANLYDADLRDADLRGADLSGADLRDADLRGADLYDADLRGANLRGANLYDANLSGVYLSGVYLSGKKIKTAAVFAGLYDYTVMPYITEDGEKWIKMGCHNRILSDWESDFWNNPTEFPDDGSVKSNLRLMAFETAKKWFEIIEKQ